MTEAGIRRMIRNRLAQERARIANMDETCPRCAATPGKPCRKVPRGECHSERSDDVEITDHRVALTVLRVQAVFSREERVRVEASAAILRYLADE